MLMADLQEEMLKRIVLIQDTLINRDKQMLAMQKLSASEATKILKLENLIMETNERLDQFEVVIRRIYMDMDWTLPPDLLDNENA